MKDLLLWLAILATGVVWADEWTFTPYTGLSTGDYYSQPPVVPQTRLYIGDVQGYTIGTPDFQIHNMQIGDTNVQGYTIGSGGTGITSINIID